MTKMKVEVLDRRQFVVVGASAAAIIAGFAGTANATPETAMELVKKLTNGGSDNAMDGKVNVDLPEIAENGNTVPVKVSVESPMTADDYVKAVQIGRASCREKRVGYSVDLGGRRIIHNKKI